MIQAPEQQKNYEIPTPEVVLTPKYLQSESRHPRSRPVVGLSSRKVETINWSAILQRIKPLCGQPYSEAKWPSLTVA